MENPATIEFSFVHAIPGNDVALGIIRVKTDGHPEADPAFEKALAELAARRRVVALEMGEEKIRQACRDMLRNGVYKPTGRGKPASEYLLRAAIEGVFPRINFFVDVNNFISLLYCVPVSFWDAKQAGTHEFSFRLGRKDESYVFNPQGQVIELEDLVVGCAGGHPIISPVKDGKITKLNTDSRLLAGCIYYPLVAGSHEHLEKITEHFFRLVTQPSDEGVWGILKPGQCLVL